MPTRGTVGVLHVDDDPSFAELVETLLERERERFEVVTETNPVGVLSRLDATAVDCIVSDYDMPGMDGLQLLEQVREVHPNIPFILFTGKGTEEVASRAISAGVTDYLQKEGGTEQFAVLANRIENAVEQREYERQFETLVNNIPGLVYRSLNTPDWEDISIRGEVEELTGYCASWLLEQNVSWADAILHPDDRERVWEEVQRQLDATGSYELTFRIVTKDGTKKWVWEHGEAVGVTADGTEILEGFVTDITDRKDRERALTQERERFSRLFEYFPEPTVAYRYEDREPVVQSVNAAFEETFGYDDQQAAGTSINDLIVPEDRMAEARELDERTRDGKLVDEELKRQTVDGERYFQFRDIPIPDDDEIHGFAVYTDIHEQNERERELQRRNDRLDEFASFVSHDLRNPLNVAMLRLGLVADECESDHLVDVENALDRMEQLIEHVLTLSRHGETVGETQPINLDSLVSQCWSNVQTSGATIDCTTGRTIYADEGRLATVLENLFRNAVAHGGEDVTITVGDLPDDAGLYVEDDGDGIAPDDRERIFESGYSTDPDGTGLGLVIVHDIVEAHGWDVRATEGSDGGARFEITGVEYGHS